MNEDACNSPTPRAVPSVTEAGITLMELLPPVGWADVATKHDMDGRFTAIEPRMDRLEARLDDVAHEIRAQTWKLMTLMVASSSASSSPRVRL